MKINKGWLVFLTNLRMYELVIHTRCAEFLESVVFKDVLDIP